MIRSSSRFRNVAILLTGIALHFSLPLTAAPVAAPLAPAGAIPTRAGAGLDAQFWKQPAGSLRSMARQGLQIIRGEPAHATFAATTLNYAGNDLLTLETWLGGDAGSLVYQTKPKLNNLDDALFRFTGYIALPAGGDVTFKSWSDDGSIVWIGGQRVINNDGYGAGPGEFSEATVHVAGPGLYQIEIVFFNADWFDDAGNHGESIIRLFVDGSPVAKGSLYPMNALGAAATFPTQAHAVPPAP